jgi:hypothetical protein
MTAARVMFVRKIPNRFHRLANALVLSCLALVACGISAGTARSEDSRLSHYVAELSASLGPKQRDALQQIPDLDRRLLALRGYVKAGAKLHARWSWTREEIERYSKSDEYSQLLQDLRKVRTSFEQKNPGFTLYANTEVRSLDTQIERWNSNVRVGATARNLRTAAENALADLAPKPDRASLDRFAEVLSKWRPSPVSPLAAPGLSMHGRMRAIDFQVMRNKQIVAATELGAVKREWDAPGWTDKLKHAVVDAGERFKGPLQSPDEPWHYEYLGGRARQANAREDQIVR